MISSFRGNLGRLRDNASQGRKCSVTLKQPVGSWSVRLGSRAFGAPESFLPPAVAWTCYKPTGPFLRNGLPGAESSRSSGKADGQSLRSFDCVPGDRKSTRLNSSHLVISYAVFCLKKKKKNQT